MGLGLAIAKTIVEGHGGRITAASQPGSSSAGSGIPGGLAVGTILVCGIFAAISGSSIVTLLAVSLGLRSIPDAKRYLKMRRM